MRSQRGRRYASPRAYHINIRSYVKYKEEKTHSWRYTVECIYAIWGIGGNHYYAENGGKG